MYRPCWNRIESERTLIFADTVFSQLEDVTETQSRDIIKENPQSFEIAVESENLYWLSKAFDPQAALIIPDDIVVDENDLKSVLMAYHASEVIPVYLAGIAGTSLDQAHELIPMTGFDLNDDYFTNILHGNLGLQDEPDPQPEPQLRNADSACNKVHPTFPFIHTGPVHCRHARIRLYPR